MAKFIRKLPDDFIMKFELGLSPRFKFKDYDLQYQVSTIDGCICLLKLVHNPEFRQEYAEIPNCRSIEAINAFLASGRFFHWHVDIGIRNENKYTSGKRYTVPFFRAV